MIRRILLFISSYIPLYILLIIKNILERITDNGKLIITIEKLKSAHFFDEINDYMIVTLALISVMSVIYLFVLLRKNGSAHEYTIIDVEDQTGNYYFNYISIYLLSCMGLTLNKVVDVFVLFFLMIIVGYIYISNHMTYMNPILQFLGYRVYEGILYSNATSEQFESIIVISKNQKLRKGSIVWGSGKDDFVFIE